MISCTLKAAPKLVSVANWPLPSWSGPEILSIGELWAVILCQNRVPLIPPWIVINFFIKINYLGVYTIFNHTQVVQVSNMSMAKSCWTPNFLVSENGIRFWTAATNFVCRQILHLIAPLFVFLMKYEKISWWIPLRLDPTLWIVVGRTGTSFGSNSLERAVQSTSQR